MLLTLTSYKRRPFDVIINNYLVFCYQLEFARVSETAIMIE